MRTVQLGQFTEEHADVIVSRLEAADIPYWVKRSGAFSRLISASDWGERIFVDSDRLGEARSIAAEVTGA